MTGLTVADREGVIAFLMSQVGQGEHPPGSNRTAAGAYMGTDGLAWCAAEQVMAAEKVLGDRSVLLHSSSCYAIAAAARRGTHGRWRPASAFPQRGWYALLKYDGDSIEHHIRCVTLGIAVNDYHYVAGNEGDRVRVGRGRTHLSGYVDVGYQPTGAVHLPAQHHPDPAAPVDIGSPPPVVKTLTVGSHGPAAEYLNHGLNVVLGRWGDELHLQGDVFTEATALGLQAFKHGANQKQWQHAAGHRVAERLFVDEANRLAGPLTLQYLRYFGLLPS